MIKSAAPVEPSEGQECWSFDIAAGDSFGMRVFVPNHRNMTDYAAGSLHFDIRTKSPVGLKVGVKSRVGDSWVPLGHETAEFGFARDGKWHSLTIPLNRFANTDFPTIHQLFMLAGDAPASAGVVSIDNVWWAPAK